MLSYLKGQFVSCVQQTKSRVILILEVNGIGYEIQIPSRLARQLSASASETNSLQVYTDQQIKDDRLVLYGFATSAERDLFRQLVGVSGVGSQLAIAAIDILGLPELVEAIVTGNTRVLTRAPGVGAKTAERISLELRTKLAQWRQETVASSTAAIPNAEIQEDLEMTLLALGYTREEIEQALSAISKDSQLAKNPNVEEWIRSAIAWLGN